jgi:hypothetical protein
VRLLGQPLSAAISAGPYPSSVRSVSVCSPRTAT